jgi:hypothetical protein
MSTYSWQNFVLVEWQQLQEKIEIADNLIVASIRIDDIKKRFYNKCWGKSRKRNAPTFF